MIDDYMAILKRNYHHILNTNPQIQFVSMGYSLLSRKKYSTTVTLHYHCVLFFLFYNSYLICYVFVNCENFYPSGR